MASTTTEPRVDVGALAGEIRNETAKRVATALVLAFDGLEEDDRGLGQLQKIELVEVAMEMFDGFERSVAIDLVDGLTHAGVPVWGFPPELADLTPEGGGGAS